MVRKIINASQELFVKAFFPREYRTIDSPDQEGKNVRRFVLLKQSLATVLVPVLVVLSTYALVNWGVTTYQSYAQGILELEKINSVFYDDFFTLLIIVDVLLLLSSFFYSDQFHKIIRNSGFVISTILIKMSFLAEGLINNALIISAVLFGYIFLIIHNLYEENSDVK